MECTAAQIGSLYRELIPKELIIRNKYGFRRWITVEVYEVTSQILGEHLAAYLRHYDQILGAISEYLIWGWSFDIMLDRLAFISVPNC